MSPRGRVKKSRPPSRNPEGRTSDEQLRSLQIAQEFVERLVENHDRPPSYGLAASLHGALGQWDEAIAFRRRLADADPHGVKPGKMLGDTLWEAGDRAAAIDAYRKTLQHDANFELDPLKRLSNEERAAVEERIGDAAPTCTKRALVPGNELYGDTEAARFGPLELKACRQWMIERGWCRRTVNNQAVRLRAMFRWAGEEGITSPSVYHELLVG